MSARESANPFARQTFLISLGRHSGSQVLHTKPSNMGRFENRRRWDKTSQFPFREDMFCLKISFQMMS